MDRIKSLSKSLSTITDRLRKRLVRSSDSADHNPISTGATIDVTDATGIHNTFSNMNVQHASGQAPLHAASNKTSEPLEVGATSMERQGSVLE